MENENLNQLPEETIPVKKKSKKGLIIGLVIGLVFSILLAFLWEYDWYVIKPVLKILVWPAVIINGGFSPGFGAWMIHEYQYSMGYIYLILFWVIVWGIVGFFSRTKKVFIIFTSILVIIVISALFYSNHYSYQSSLKVVDEEKLNGPAPVYEHNLEDYSPFMGGNIIGQYEYNLEYDDDYYSEDAIRVISERKLTEEEAIAIENELPGIFCGMKTIYAKFSKYENDVYDYDFCLTPYPKSGAELFEIVEEMKNLGEFIEVTARIEITMDDLGPYVPAD